MKRKLLKAVLIFCLFSPELGEGTGYAEPLKGQIEQRLYSIQIRSFKNLWSAKELLSRLPENLKRKAFVYRTNSGFYTVRVFLSHSVKKLLPKRKLLKNEGFKDAFIVKTDVKKVHYSPNFEESDSKVLKEVEVYKGDKRSFIFETQGKGSSKPKVPNKTDLFPGTPENRRVKVRAVTVKLMKNTKRIDLGEIIDKGLYSVKMKFSYIYPEDNLNKLVIYIKLPKEAKFVKDSALINGKKTKVKLKKNILIFRKEEVNGNEPLNLDFKFLAKKALKVKHFPYCIFAKTEEGKAIDLCPDKHLIEKAAESGKQKNVLRKRRFSERHQKKGKIGIIYPGVDITQPQSSTDVLVSIPFNSNYSVLLNGERISEKYLAEKTIDKTLGLLTLKYVSVPLKKGENTIVLKFNGKEEKRRILVSDEVADFKFRTFPEKPPADGRSSAYVEIQTIDKNGRPAKINTYLKVYVDKGDIYDYKTNQYKKFTNDGFKISVMGGRAVLRLSPAKKPEERRIKIVYGELEREFTVRYYQEKRPWIVVGELEGGVGFSRIHNNPPKTANMPYDHSSSGTHFRGRGAIFAKGTVKDYTITLRYDTKKPENVLSQQNIPSTEEGQFYPIYGDESEQYFEAKSKDKLYLRIDKELSYALYGDYSTDFGRGLDFNRYSRMFNGVLTNIEDEENYRIRFFVSKNKQDIVKEEFKGRGISGPFFLHNTPLEFSEKVWIEIRDRYNPDIVLERRQLNRFTDYDINYEEGFIILHEPLPEFDKNFNPEFLIIRYETEKLNKDRYMFGIRGEKWLNKIRIGSFFVKEEHQIKDKKFYGVDAYYYQNGLKFVSELSHSSGFTVSDLNPTSGSAFRTELSYNAKNFNAKLFYKRVTDGFQNPSSTTAEESYTNYGFNFSRNFRTLKVSANGLFDDRNSIKRKTSDLILNKQFNDKISLNFGTRWNQEEKKDKTESYTQAIAGINLKPTEKTSITLTREQSLSGKKESSYYPTRTTLKMTYKWNSETETYLQTEIREQPDRTETLTTFGIDSNMKIDENTTAFSKYTIDDGASGWRTQSHIGLNHVFKWKDDFAVDVGAENVHTFNGGSGNGDYTAIRLRGVYTQNEKYKLSGEYQVRFGDVNTEHLLNAGGIFKLGKDYTALLRERYFLSDYKENDVLIGIARRPVGWDKFNYLLKLRWKISDSDEITNKYIFSWHLNYQPVKRLTLMGEYAAKYIDEKNVGNSFSDLIRGRVLYDVTNKVDFGFHAGILRQHNTNTYNLSLGPEMGYNLFKNFWISVGYNFNGFYDEDFDDANYWSRGLYFKFRLKFDENSFRKLRNHLKRREEKK